MLLTEDQPPWVETAFLCHVNFDGRSLLPVTETKELLFLEANPFSNHTVNGPLVSTLHECSRPILLISSAHSLSSGSLLSQRKKSVCL